MPMPPPVPPVRTRADSMTPTSTYSPIPRRKDFLPEFRWAALRWGRTTTPTRSCMGKTWMPCRLSVMAQPSPRLLVKGWWTSSTGCRRCANNNRPMEHGGELASAFTCQLAPSPTEPRLHIAFTSRRDCQVVVAAKRKRLDELAVEFALAILPVPTPPDEPDPQFCERSISRISRLTWAASCDALSINSSHFLLFSSSFAWARR